MALPVAARTAIEPTISASDRCATAPEQQQPLAPLIEPPGGSSSNKLSRGRDQAVGGRHSADLTSDSAGRRLLRRRLNFRKLLSHRPARGARPLRLGRWDFRKCQWPVEPSDGGAALHELYTIQRAQHLLPLPAPEGSMADMRAAIVWL